MAGKRAGMKHEDMGDDEVTRSGLFMDQVRIVKEMRNGTNGVKPRYMVWENVPGAFSSNKRDDFRTVLEETARIADPTVSIPRSPGGWSNSGSILGDGFSVSWRTFDTQYWGVPQRRRRIYLVADFGGSSAPEILFERESVSWYPAQGEGERQGVAGEVEGGIRTAIPINTQIITRHKALGKGTGFGMGEDGDPAYTLQAGHEHGVICLDMTHANDVIRECGDTVPTLQARMGTGGNQIPLVQEPAYTMLMREGKEGGGKGPLVQTERASTLTVGGQQTLFEPISLETYHCENNEGVASVLKARDWKGPQCVSEANQSVRSLTPLECEHLQGYADGWTDIPGKKTVTEEDMGFWRPVFDTLDDIMEEKHHTDKQIKRWLMSSSADSDRYQSLGNSFAIPNAIFVISGCVEVLERSNQSNGNDIY